MICRGDTRLTQLKTDIISSIGDLPNVFCLFLTKSYAGAYEVYCCSMIAFIAEPASWGGCIVQFVSLVSGLRMSVLLIDIDGKVVVKYG